MNKKLTALLLTSLVFITATGAVIAVNAESDKKGVTVAKIDEKDAEFLKNNPLVPLYTPNDRYYSSKQYVSHNHLGDIESVWSTYKGEGTKIAVIDTGINYKHPDFKKKDGTTSILPESKYYYIDWDAYELKCQTASIDGYDILLHDWDEKYSEWDSHGTNSAGCAAARTGDGVGTIGIAPEADLLIYKTDMNLFSISYAIQDAVNQKADVINMSLGAYAENFVDGYGEQQEGSSSTATYLQDIIDWAYSKGVIIVAAAGNEKTDHHSYPACNTHVIGVGALAGNSSTTAAGFSNFNYTTENDPSGDHNVDVVAPGYVYTPDMGGSRSSINYSAYCDTQGTSFASPIVAGAAALWKQKNKTGTPDQFERELYATCVDIGSTGFDYKYGNGRLDVKELLSVGGFDRVELLNHEKTVYTGADHKSTLEVSYASSNITWSSEDTTIATVDSNGAVTGHKAGKTTITAKVGDASDTCEVTVLQYVPATSIELAEDSGTVEVGGTVQIEATVLPSNATQDMVLFESMDEDIATVDDDGLVTGVSEGSTSIYIMGPEDTEAYFDVTVTAASEKVYTKVTSSLTNWAGDYLFVYEDGSSSKAFDGSLSTMDVAANTITVSPVSGKIVSNSTTNASKFTISKGSASGKYWIKSSSNYYIYGQSGSNTLKTAANGSSTTDCAISFSDSVPTITNNSTYLTFNNADGQKRFRFMKSVSTPIAMYKLESGEASTPDKILDHITVSYTGGDVVQDASLDQSKITVTAHYTEPTYFEPEVVTGWSLSGFSSSTLGSVTVTVTYQGKEATFSLNIVEDPSSPLTSLTISGVPASIKYRSTFSKDGISATAHYSKKADADVTSLVTLPDIDTSRLGEGIYEVSYTENGITKTASATYKVTNHEAQPVISVAGATYTLVTNASQLEVGGKYVIAAGYASKAMSTTQNSNNRPAATISKSGDKKTISFADDAGVQIVELGLGYGGNNYSLIVGENQYLMASGNNSNYYLKTTGTLNSTSSWTISITSASTGKAVITGQGSNTNKILKYNTSGRFEGRASGGDDIVLYKQNVTEASSSWDAKTQSKDFASYFLRLTSEGCSLQSKSNLSSIWNELKYEFDEMLENSKGEFVSSTDTTVMEARERYVIIVTKYGLDAFVDEATGESLTAMSLDKMNIQEDLSMGLILVSSIGLLSLGGFLLLKKKH